MTRYSYEIIEKAKELYLTPDKQGNHKYSLRAIASEISRIFNKEVSYGTVSHWAKKFGWERVWGNAVKQGITEAVAKHIEEENNKQQTIEEQYQEAIANKKKEDFVIATNLKRMGYQYIKENGFTSALQALKAIEVGLNFTLEENKNQESLADFLMKLIGDNGESENGGDT